MDSKDISRRFKMLEKHHNGDDTVNFTSGFNYELSFISK